MKHILKNLSNEPEKLKDYREKTPNATYKGYIDSNQALKKALLEEQGHICAYCMGRISLKQNKKYDALGRTKSVKPRIEIEHYLSQDSHPEQTLNYQNMLGVCNGDLKGSEHCDKSKKEVNLQILNPLDEECEQRIDYSTSGEIESLTGIQEVEEDLMLLNLNDQNLIDARRNAIDIALEWMKKSYPIKQWTKKLIQKEIDSWEKRGADGKFRPYCKIVVWFWKNQQRSNRYPPN